ncbi:tRNA pseudouridine(38-40) synthase TruA [Fructilactobacillus lindneri]|uniref:tRNA pseudouridine synthase A n=2 Tax=Fructilactobacillus lindneri TaxID=53444 RepID=A0A0R2JN20_9LACO|nr:tRNA pseudouridine(38-40) synthase TruA [Fructilactobacillus lindneri]ANZ57953.1 tRNA pseudouridine(38,39,40) synthase TruA [Fructilactobacillus lindneri]ANZ59223.1 tRNA pseudouridine(38,39,40) synthase TruA [Fructilactobacillus lindneri]KRN78575.1 tRNA pseudouridine synthase A [Fructilactobacillus lindneri DSM 20690 = JCM 11027]POG98273.1 tRNA pseudouridine(38-40) synthase TruA [Fructilactobacillus lindneri]POH01610.1 tRNA pseudouridine(38-40) synthase TruA [Fructilactobacillus lindneri]
MTNRYKITFAYDGTKFAGFQKQPQQRTIEGVLTRVVNKMAKRADGEISVYGSGRTDAGVHALAQVAHFDFPFDIPADSMLKGLNSMCPLDIEVKDVEIVSNDFHARYDVTGKKYLYRISQGRFTDPFKRNYTAHWRLPIDFSLIDTAIQDFVGKHDFSSFVASGAKPGSRIRTIFAVNAIDDEVNDEIQLEFYGDGFMYNQIRIMVAVLVEIGMGKRPVHDIQRLLKVKDRQQARLTMPANGLYLKKVYYPGDDPKHSMKKHQQRD